MDAAQKLLKNTALFLATALLIAVPGRAQSQLILSSATVALNNNQAQSIQVTTSGTSALSYTVSGVPSWLSAFSANNQTTPDILYFQLRNTICGSCTASVTLTPVGAGNGSPVTVTVTYSPGTTGGSGTLIANPSSLTFSASAGQSAGSQNVTVSTTTSTLLSFSTTSDQSWLSATIVNGSFSVSSASPVTLSVAASAFNLANGTYTGHITLTPSVRTATTITVTFTVGMGTGGTGTIFANPSSLTFSAAAGQTSTIQNVTLSSNSSSTVTILGIVPDVTWLSTAVSSPQINSSNSANLQVLASAAALSNGTYTGHLTINPSVGTPTVIPVTFIVETGSSGATINASPGSLTFSANSGTSTGVQNVSLTTPSSSTISFSINYDVAWLFASPSATSINSSSSANLPVTASASSLTNGTYTGHITLTPSSGTQTVITVTFNVGTTSASHGTITSTPSSFNFSYPSNTLSGLVTIGSTNASVTSFNINISSQSNWLLIQNVAGSFTNVQFGSFSVAVNQNVAASLPPGTYSGTITLTNPSNSSDTTVINLTLTVNGGTGTGGTLTVSPTALSFTASPGGPPQSQTLTVTAPSNSSVTLTATNYNGTFFSLSSPSCNGTVSSTFNCTFTGSQTVTVTVNPGIATGVANFTGGLLFQTGTSSVSVSLVMSLNAGVSTLTVNPTALTFSAAAGSVAQSQNVPVQVPGSALVTATLSSFNGNFFSVSYTNCNANPSTNTVCSFNGNQTLNVQVNPATLTNAGTYNGIIQLQSGGVTINVTVSLTLTTGSSIAAPASLSFTYQTNSQALVPPQVITVGAVATFGATASVTTSQQWLVVSAVGNSGPGYVIVSVSPQGLSAGATYQGTITINSTSGSVTIPVTLIVSSGVVIEAVPGSVYFSFQSGSAAAQEDLQLQASDNSSTPVAASTTTPWITIGTSSGSNTPAAVQLTINPAGLCNGLNTGSIAITAPNAANNRFTIPVVALLSGSSVTTNCNTGSTGPLTASPGSLTFNAASGQSAGPQNVILSTNSSSAVSIMGIAPDVSWLSITVSSLTVSSTTPATLSVIASAANLPSGTYTGHLTINSVGGSTPTAITVTFNVTGSGSSQLVVNSATVALNDNRAQSIQVTASGTSALSYTISGVPFWLSAFSANNQTTPDTLYFQLTNTSCGSCTASVTLTPVGAGSGSPVTVTVTYSPGTTGGGTILVNPSTLMFSANSGFSAAGQSVSLTTSSSSAISFGVNYDVNWLSASVIGGSSSNLSSGNPATLFVAASAASLTSGTYTGHITVTPSSGSQTVITVTFIVGTAGSSHGTITASQTSFSFTYPSNTLSGVVTIGSTNPSVYSFNLNISSQSNWLLFQNVTGSFSAVEFGSYSVAVNSTVAASLPSGTYSGTITLSNPSNASDTTTINLTLTVNSTTVPGVTSVALRKTATQSSTLPGTPPAGAAVDGNSDGLFFDGSVTATNFDTNAWWQVDLGASAAVSNITIWNRTDCCDFRLNDFWVFVSDTPFLPTDTPTTLQNRVGTFSSHQTTAPEPSITIPFGVQGRYVRVQLTFANYLSLAEVEVMGTGGSPQPTNVALGKSAAQSSTLPGTPPAGAAVDGNTDGGFFNGSVTATNLENNPWWQVDLGSSVPISSIVVWNRTDCCASRLNDYWVFVSDTPFLPTDTPATLQSRAGTFASHQTSAPNPSTTIAAATQGRYVRVQLTSPNYLSLAEVQVMGTGGSPQPTNVAAGKTATQSSTLVGYPSDIAGAAADGNTDGSFRDGSVTATDFDMNAWWQVDLGASAAVSNITIWNRTDCCDFRLNDFWVFVSDTPFLPTDTPTTLQNRAGTFSSHQTTAPEPSVSIPFGVQGRYVRVQLTFANYLSLAEVQVFAQ